jgi:acetyltransferase
MERLIVVARERGIRRLIGLVLRENAGMLGLAKALGFREGKSIDHNAVQIVLDL